MEDLSKAVEYARIETQKSLENLEEYDRGVRLTFLIFLAHMRGFRGNNLGLSGFWDIKRDSTFMGTSISISVGDMRLEVGVKNYCYSLYVNMRSIENPTHVNLYDTFGQAFHEISRGSLSYTNEELKETFIKVMDIDRNNPFIEAVCMSQHSRLGAKSLLRFFSNELLEDLCGSAFDEPSPNLSWVLDYFDGPTRPFRR
jgi:hypothetical protein